jgi:hypothetical protein
MAVPKPRRRTHPHPPSRRIASTARASSGSQAPGSRSGVAWIHGNAKAVPYTTAATVAAAKLVPRRRQSPYVPRSDKRTWPNVHQAIAVTGDIARSSSRGG